MRYRHVIKDAIDRRKVIKLRYKDVTRRVRPHILGYVGHDELALSGWQISGRRGVAALHVNDISELTATEQGFHGTARGYNPNDPAFSRIIDRI